MTNMSAGSQFPKMSRKPTTREGSVIPEMANPRPKMSPEMKIVNSFMRSEILELVD